MRTIEVLYEFSRFVLFAIIAASAIILVAKVIHEERRVEPMAAKPTIIKCVPTSVTIDEATGKTNVVIEIITE